MAIVTKIREKSGIAIGVIAISMIAFIVGGDLLSPNSKLMGGKKDVIGVIDGTEIGLDEFARKVEEISNRYTLQLGGRRPNDQEMEYIRQEAWGSLVNDLVMVKEFAKIGIEVTGDEIRDMVQGNNIHPAIAQSFKDEKGVLDVKRLKEFLAGIANKSAPVDQQMQFFKFESELAPERKTQKYEKLMSASIYATKLEAEQEYNYQNNRVDIKFVTIPFNTIVDSTVAVTDAQIKDYFDKNRSKYKVEANRAIEYVNFSFKPSSADSAVIRKELEDVAQRFAAIQDDTTFAQANSDDSNTKLVSYKIGDLPKNLKAVPTADVVVGKVFGPYLDGGRYNVYKISGTKEDSVYSMRASHILFSTKDKPATEKPVIRKKAEDVLAQIKKGNSFEGMAAVYGEDGTRQSGGDLNWFKEGQMVKAFNDAVMKSPVGLIPTLIETEFGYHIIKVTEPKTKQQLQIATVSREIVPSEKTRETAYRLAADFAKSTDKKQYDEAVKTSQSYLSMQALTIAQDAKYINNLTGSKVREIVRWAYKEDTELGGVSEVFELDDQYLVALLREKREKGDAKLEDVKEMVTARVREEEKAKMIIAKLANTTASLDDIAKTYGQGASVFTQEDVNLFTLSLNGTGSATQTIGRAAALPKGTKTKAYKDDSGVMILEIVNVEDAPKIADHNTYKDQIVQKKGASVMQNVMKAIKKLTKTEDYIAKYY
jgi:peptidyl-prolyl cis-trans isomerase D